MNDHEYHEQLLKLSAELFCAGSARPYDPNAYNAVIDKLNKLSQIPIQDQRVIPRVMKFAIVAAILFVLYLIYDLICEVIF